MAVNKIDKPGANPNHVIEQLTEYGLIPEDWGGDTIFVQISAKFGTNIDDLLDMILLQAEVMELKANPEQHAAGSVIEAELDQDVVQLPPSWFNKEQCMWVIQLLLGAHSVELEP